MKIPVTPLLGKTRKIHFIGIGGTGMSGIAEVLINLGYQVTGSDLAGNQAIDRLISLGGKVSIGHRADQVVGADVVVVSSAVRKNNEELAQAERLQIPTIPRAEMLGELMRMKYSIGIAGSHGKTSTTSMIAQVLSDADLDPTIVIGGRLGVLGSNAKLGRGDLLVAEADESDGSFLKLSPKVAVVTNIDAEHLDHFGDLARLRGAFCDFLNRVPFYGASILCVEDPHCREVLPQLTRRTLTYGIEQPADLSATDIRLHGRESAYTAHFQGKKLGSVRLRVPGTHNILNSLAALAVGQDLELPFRTITASLADFQGAERRFQILGEIGGILVVDDYAHHPTEIRATLAAARAGWPDRRRVVVFQPHRYSRVQALAGEFHRCFTDADLLIVTDIYPAGEDPIPGVEAESLVEGIRATGHPRVEFLPDLETIPERLLKCTASGDLVLTLGAGTVGRVAAGLAERLKRRNRTAEGRSR